MNEQSIDPIWAAEGSCFSEGLQLSVTEEWKRTTSRTNHLSVERLHRLSQGEVTRETSSDLHSVVDMCFSQSNQSHSITEAQLQ